MKKETFVIPNISCNHCVNAIKNELLEHAAVTLVTGDAETHTIVVDHDGTLSTDEIKAILAEINYPAQ